MTHRIVALAILLLVARAAWLANWRLGPHHPLAKVSGAWLGLIVGQVFLGAATIWTGKSADIATAHVAFGALSLMTGAMLAIIAFRCLMPAPRREAVRAKLTPLRSEEHTSELQSQSNLVCRLLLEKTKTIPTRAPRTSSHPAGHSPLLSPDQSARRNHDMSLDPSAARLSFVPTCPAGRGYRTAGTA